MFQDRAEAGKQLSQKLKHLVNQSEVIVLALPRGGVEVAFEVARALKAPLDIMIVRKIGVPGNEELAMGAIASGGVTVVNEQLIRFMTIGKSIFEEVARKELEELTRRETAYRRGRAPHTLQNKTVVVVDDGLATGATMRAAVAAVRKANPDKVIVAVPVASQDVSAAFRSVADEIVTVITPQPFGSVGTWYENFDQVSDDEVQCLLDAAERTWSAA